MYAEPRHITDIDACLFYHTVDLPTHGIVHGQWDLRPNLDRYVSPLDYDGRRVLEVGTADGQLCFEIERRGAEVVALDLKPGLSYDALPVHDPALDGILAGMHDGLDRIRNAYWLSHRLLKSRARVLHGHVSELPAGIGVFDVGFMGNVLQHLESPIRAIAEVCRVTREALVITEAYWDAGLDPAAPRALFLPALRGTRPLGEWGFSWWQLTPGLIRSWLDILGFDVTDQYTHEQLMTASQVMVPHFTIVARRRAEFVNL